MRRIGLILLTALLLLSGCRAEEKGVTPAEGDVAVYYANITSTRLTTATYHPKETEPVELAKELFDKMSESGLEDSMSAVPTEITLDQIQLTGNTLSVYLNGALENLDSSIRMLFLAAMTRTFTQIKDVDGIMVYSNGNPAVNADGTPFGVLKVSGFVDNAVDNPEDYRERELTLYFANETMDQLITVKRSVVYRSSSSLERIVVEQLLRGPESGETGSPTLPATASLLSINVRDGICYVNFDGKFITEVLGAYDYIPVYSVVNSLTELPDISKVQISINGSSETAFQRDILSFAVPFERNLDYVLGE